MTYQTVGRDIMKRPAAFTFAVLLSMVLWVILIGPLSFLLTQGVRPLGSRRVCLSFFFRKQRGIRPAAGVRTGERPQRSRRMSVRAFENA